MIQSKWNVGQGIGTTLRQGKVKMVKSVFQSTLKLRPKGKNVPSLTRQERQASPERSGWLGGRQAPTSRKSMLHLIPQDADIWLKEEGVSTTRWISVA